MPVGVVLVLIFASTPLILSSPINRQVGISQDVFITLQNDTYGHEHRVCSIDSQTFGDGETIPTSSPCEHCICRPPGFACTIISCEYRAGCKAIKRSNQCCPEYQCECEKDGKIYGNGEKIVDGTNPCEICYCQGGEILCAVIDCYWRSDCQPRYVQDRCCPLYDHCPPPHQSQGPFAQRITSTSPPLLASSTGGPFPWANLSSAVFNNEIDRPTVIIATSKPQVAILGSEVEEEKKEIFSAPHYLPEPPIKTELSPPPQKEEGEEQHQEQVNEQKEEASMSQAQPVVPSSEILPPPREVTTTQSPSSSSSDIPVDELKPTTQSVQNDVELSNDQVAETTIAPSSGVSFSVADNAIPVEPTEQPLAGDEGIVAHDHIDHTTEQPSISPANDEPSATESSSVVSEVDVVTTSVNFVHDEPEVTTEREVELLQDEPLSVTTEASVVSLDEVVQTTEKSSQSAVQEEEISHSDDVATTETPLNNDEVATTENIVRDSLDEIQSTANPSADEPDVEVTEVPSQDDVTEATGSSDLHDLPAPTTQVPLSGADLDEPAGTEIPFQASHDDSEVIPTTLTPLDEVPIVQSHDEAEVVNAAANEVNVSSEDIIPPEEGNADLPEIHNQVFAADEDTVELSAAVTTVKVEPSSTAVPVAADEPATTLADKLEDDDEEDRQTDDHHGDAFNGAEEMTDSPNTESPSEDVANRFRLDLSSNEISSEDKKKSEDNITPDATTVRIFRDELTSVDDATTPASVLHDEVAVTTESSFIQRDDFTTNSPPSADSRLRTALGESDELVEISTISAIRSDVESSATTELPSKFRSDLFELEKQDETEATTTLSVDEIPNDEAVQSSTLGNLNDEIPTTFAPSRLRSDLFDSVESVEKTTVAPTRLRSGLLNSVEQDEPVEQSTTLRQEAIKPYNEDEGVSFDEVAKGETTIAPSRLRSELISSEERGDDAIVSTTSFPNRFRTEDEKTTQVSLNDESYVASELTTEGSSSRLRSGLVDEDTSSTEAVGVSTIIPPSRLRSALSQELFSSEDDPVQTTSASSDSAAALSDESSSSDTPTTASAVVGNRLRNSEDGLTTPASSVVYQDFVELTTSAPIQEEIVSYTSQQNIRSGDHVEDDRTTETILFQDEVQGTTLQPSEFKSEAIEASTAFKIFNDEEENIETTFTPPVARPQSVDIPSMIPPVDPAMSLRQDDIHSDDGLSSDTDSWFTATYNKLRALAGLFPKNDASPKSKKRQRSPRRHNL